MRTSGSERPTPVYLEPYDLVPGYTRVRVAEDVREVDPPAWTHEEGKTAPEHWYEWDEYVYHVPTRDGLQAEIESNPQPWLLTGRMLEHGDTSENADMEEALAVMGVIVE